MSHAPPGFSGCHTAVKGRSHLLQESQEMQLQCLSAGMETDMTTEAKSQEDTRWIFHSSIWITFVIVQVQFLGSPIVIRIVVPTTKPVAHQSNILQQKQTNTDVCLVCVMAVCPCLELFFGSIWHVKSVFIYVWYSKKSHRDLRESFKKCKGVINNI